MQGTKEKIRKAALKRFNEEGIVNVRLQHIADEAFVSVGNLAYHYPNKEHILLALYEELTLKQQELLAEYRIVPLFDNIDRLLHHTFQLQETYQFFYADTLEIIRANPDIARAHQSHITYQLNQLVHIIEFNIARGALLALDETEQIHALARQIWITMDFWLSQEMVSKGALPKLSDYRKAIWYLLMPHFSPMGKKEFEQMLQMPYDFFY
jgi:AcrR family transcriptional regulator